MDSKDKDAKTIDIGDIPITIGHVSLEGNTYTSTNFQLSEFQCQNEARNFTEMTEKQQDITKV